MDSSGFDVQLAEEQPSLDSLYHTDCAICHLVLCNPCETTCCGVYFCKACVEKHHEQQSSCPHCKERLGWHESKAQGRLIKQLKFACKHKDRGCRWVGELGQLSKHLNENSPGNSDTGCKFVLLECPLCHKHMNRGNFNSHKAEKCPLKDIKCTNHEKGCDWNGQQRAAAEHLNLNPVGSRRFEGCGFVELNCVHDCGQSIERRELEQHEAQCQLELIECDFKALGCEATVPRKDMQAHLLQPKHHVKQACQACISLQKLTRDSKSELDSLHLSLKQTKLVAFSALLIGILLGALFGYLSAYDGGGSQEDESILPTDQSQLLMLPVNLTLRNYSVHKDLGVSWISPPLSWPDGNFTFYVDVHSIRQSYSYPMVLYVQFRASGSYYSLKANITLHLVGPRYFKQRIFQVEFGEWGSQSEVVTGYQLFLNTEGGSEFVVNDQLQFRVLQIQIGWFVYPLNIFTVCNLHQNKKWQNDRILMLPTPFYTPYGSVLIELSAKQFDKQLYIRLTVHKFEKYNGGIVELNVSFYLASGGVLQHSVSSLGDNHDHGFFVLSYNEFQQRVISDNCLAFEISSFKISVSSTRENVTYFCIFLTVLILLLISYVRFAFRTLDLHY